MAGLASPAPNTSRDLVFADNFVQVTLKDFCSTILIVMIIIDF